MTGISQSKAAISGSEPKSNGSDARPFRVSCILIPGFSMLALSSAIEPLRSVNRIFGSERYHWQILGDAKGPVCSSNRLEIQASHDLGDPPAADLTIIVASLELETYSSRKLTHHIRWLHRQGMRLGAISNGTFLLAAAGILDGRRATIHWESLDQLTAKYPDVDASRALFCVDRTIFTAAGGASAMDMMLQLISSREGPDVASDVAEQFLHGAARPASELQRDDLRWRYRLTDPRLETVIRLMEANHAVTLSVAELAARVDLSERQLERLFLRELNESPSRFYLDLRLRAARNRLVATTIKLDEIADMSGFSSQAHFSRAFKSWCGSSPLAVRKGLPEGDVGKV
ncbi:GlxA family transcriptional regulator [Marinovum algicola]|uniref:GlxA family transcriptional regulator n=2 Tax=Rhodobacterales TaxID=204455 RepID=UPI0032ECB197